MALINMPAEPQLWDKEKLQEDNTAYKLECEIAEEEWKTETMQEENQKLLWGCFSKEQMNKSKETKDLELVDKYNDNEVSLEEITQLFDKLLINNKINWEEYNDLCNRAVDGKEIDITQYLERENSSIWIVEELEHEAENFQEERRNLTKNLHENAMENIQESYFSHNEVNDTESSESSESWELEWNEDIQDLLDNENVRKDNFNKGMELFYSDNNPDFTPEDNEFLWLEEVQDDLESILGNFLVETNITDFNELSIWDQESVNDVLNSSFDLQVSKLIKNKANYPTITVENYIKEIHDWEPIDKIKAYEELKEIINHKEWISWKAMEKWKNSIMNKIKLKATEKVDNYIQDIKTLMENKDIVLTNKQKEKLTEELKQLETIEDSMVKWEVFSWDLSIESIWEKNIWEGNDAK